MPSLWYVYTVLRASTCSMNRIPLSGADGMRNSSFRRDARQERSTRLDQDQPGQENPDLLRDDIRHTTLGSTSLPISQTN